LDTFYLPISARYKRAPFEGLYLMLGTTELISSYSYDVGVLGFILREATFKTTLVE